MFGKEDQNAAVRALPFYNRVSKRLLFLAVLLGCILGIFVVQPIVYPTMRGGPPGEFMLFLMEQAERWPVHLSFLSMLDTISVLTTMPEISFQVNFPGEMIEKTRKIVADLLNYQDNEGVSLSETLLGFPGREAKNLGWQAHYPVILIPGMTSTGLEVWESEGCASAFFRDRIWGTLSMFHLMLLKKACWIRHILLDPCHGKDPFGIKLRAAQGLEAADYLMPGYWVWGKMIEALASIGYDTTLLSMASYDWRLSFEDLEIRDHYFTRLAGAIEMNLLVHEKKTVLLAHSLGSLVILYFFQWANHYKGETWVEMHVDTLLSIGGPFLGLPKALSSLLSGEMKDTAQMGILESYFLELFLSKKERALLFQSWSCLTHLLPMGNSSIWDLDLPKFGKKDSTEEQNKEFTLGGGAFIYSKNLGLLVNTDSLITFLRRFPYFPDFFHAKLARCFKENCESQNEHHHGNNTVINGLTNEAKSWANPFKSPLPNAPNMKFYVAYGIGQPTERAYFYTNTTVNFALLKEPIALDSFSKLCGTMRTNVSDEYLNSLSTSDRDPSTSGGGAEINFAVDTSINVAELSIRRGVLFTDGDGTVPLLSAGYMSIKGWRSSSTGTTCSSTLTTSPLNPFGVQVFTREYIHEPIEAVSRKGINVRGGPKTSDHVDILGNHHLTLDILKIVSGNNIVKARQSDDKTSENVSTEMASAGCNSTTTNSSQSEGFAACDGGFLGDLIESNIREMLN